MPMPSAFSPSGGAGLFRTGAHRGAVRRGDLIEPKQGVLIFPLLKALLLVTASQMAVGATSRAAMMMRRPAVVPQPSEPLPFIALQPLVAGLPADAESGANLALHRPFFPHRQHKTHPFFHGAGLSPRRQQTPCRALKTRQPCIRYKLSALYPGRVRGLQAVLREERESSAAVGRSVIVRLALLQFVWPIVRLALSWVRRALERSARERELPSMPPLLASWRGRGT